MANGIIIVDKPAGWTSQDVVAKLRGVFHTKRVGHGGTLDPMATGVLPVFVGRATRAASFCESAEKEYIAQLRLGLVTNTQDTTGQVLSEQPVTVTRQALSDVLQQFTGQISQIPPMFSAVKIGGKKLYELARKGQEIERKPRAVTIFELELLDGAGEEYTLRVRCSKGTYIRTLCHDIGQALGCGGCMSALRRTKAGSFSLSQSLSMDKILAHPDAEQLLLPVDSLFSQHPAHHVTQPQAQKLRNGAAVQTRNVSPGFYRVYDESGEFLLLGRVQSGILSTVKSFFEVDT